MDIASAKNNEVIGLAGVASVPVSDASSDVSEIFFPSVPLNFFFLFLFIWFVGSVIDSSASLGLPASLSASLTPAIAGVE